MDQNITKKVQQYEEFLNDTLKEDLKTLQEQLKKVNEQLANWYLLKKTISDIREHHSTGYKTHVDVGCGVLCQAVVTDPSVININLGLNVYLEMTLDEANQFCDIKIKILKREVEHIQKQAIKVNAHIKIVLLGLQELQKL